jgi:hypothetical protein
VGGVEIADGADHFLIVGNVAASDVVAEAVAEYASEVFMAGYMRVLLQRKAPR